MTFLSRFSLKCAKEKTETTKRSGIENLPSSKSSFITGDTTVPHVQIKGDQSVSDGETTPSMPTISSQADNLDPGLAGDFPSTVSGPPQSTENELTGNIASQSSDSVAPSSELSNPLRLSNQPESSAVPGVIEGIQVPALGPAASILHAQKEDVSIEHCLEKEREALLKLKLEYDRIREELEAISRDLPSHPEWRQIQDLSIVEYLNGMNYGDREQKIRAAHQIRILAKYSSENRVLIAEAGGIAPLVEMASGDDPDEVSESVTALLNLSIQNQTNLKALPAFAAVPALVQVMMTGTWETRENAVAALYSLSLNDNNKIVIGAADAIPPMVQILRNGSDQGKNDACKGLFNLSIFNTNKIRILEAGGVQPLIEFMQDTKSSIAEKSVSVLANLSTIAKGREAIAQDEDGIPLLVEVVESGTNRGKENAAAALWQLAKNSLEYRQMILEESVIPPLVALSQTGTSRAKEKAKALVENLRRKDL